MKKRFQRRALTARALAILVGATLWLLPKCSWAALICDAGAIQSAAASGTTIASAVEIPASGSVPAFCDVKGSVATPGNEDNFELGLPDVWNGKFIMFGNGGFAGTIPSLKDGLSRGYAAAGTDTGHPASAGASFALDPAQLADYMFRSIHAVAAASKVLVQTFYSDAISRSYFDGCSTGGRQGLIEVQQFPDDFDGVIAGAPVFWAHMMGLNWNMEAQVATADGYVSAANAQLVSQEVSAKCDIEDGVADGLIQDPRQCKLDVDSLLFLSTAQKETLKKIFTGPKEELTGQQLYPPMSMSDLSGGDGWPLWVTGRVAPSSPGTAEPFGTAFPPLDWLLQDGFMKFFVFQDPDFDSLLFQRTPEQVELLRRSTRDGDPSKTNLSSFTRRGGKLILYHGFSDPGLTPLRTIEYYEDLIQRSGGVQKLQQSVRLFMVPGMHHCGGGPGPNVFDTISALDNWVDKGIAPDEIIATHFVNNNPSAGVDRTMPLCPFPTEATYLGGPVDLASSWSCALNRKLLSGSSERGNRTSIPSQ